MFKDRPPQPEREFWQWMERLRGGHSEGRIVPAMRRRVDLDFTARLPAANIRATGDANSDAACSRTGSHRLAIRGLTQNAAGR
jgi:hypothetical protein